MQDQWQTLLEDLWPSRSLPRHLLWRREALLFMAIAMVIAVAAGPEVIAAMEMTTLMELLGASLFLTALGAGARMVFAELWIASARVLLPAPQLAVARSDASARTRAMALVYVSMHAVWVIALVVIVGAWVHFTFRLTA